MAIVVDPGIATMTNDELVAVRQNLMKEDGRVLQAAATLAGDDAVAAATTLLQNFTNFPALFKEGSVTPNSHALPIIWNQFDDFTAMFAEGRAIATQMTQAARSGNAAQFGDLVEAMRQTCSECHEVYRSAYR